MEKRFLIAFVITFVFFIGYSHFVNKYFPQQTVNQQVIEDIAVPNKEVVSQERNETFRQSIKKPKKEEILKEKIGNFYITFSLTGGYIKNLTIEGAEKILPFENIGFVEEDKNFRFKPTVKGNKVIFQRDGGKTKTFIFEGYNIGIEFSIPPTSPVMIFSNDFGGKGWDMDQRYQEIFYSTEKGLERSSPKKTKEKAHKNVFFAGGRGRYYCLSLAAGEYDVEWVKNKTTGYLYLNSPESSISLYVGPQVPKYMEPFGVQGVVNYGFFHIIGVIMVKLLYFLHSLLKNWGLSIIVFSGLIYLVLFPFTAKSTKAMKRMQEFQPEIEALKEKYKDNPQKLQKETVALYREHKINPLGGCLPLLFQFPVFIALYQVLFRLVDLKGAGFLWIKDLAAPDRLFQLPFTIPILKTEYLNILPLCIAVLGLIQQRIVTASPSASPSAQASQQKTMGMFMSVFIGFIFYKFPSALVLYWLTQNVLTIIYQIQIRKTPSAS